MSPRSELRGSPSVRGRPPAQAWPAVQHHGLRIALLVFLAASTYLLFPVSPMPDLPDLQVGDIHDEDVIARVDVTVYKSEAELARDRFEAAALVAPTFVYDSAAIDTMRTQIAQFTAYVDSAIVRPDDEAGAIARLRQVLNAHSLPSGDDVVTLLMSPSSRSALWGSLDRTSSDDMTAGVANAQVLDEYTASQVRVVQDGGDRLVDRDSVFVQAELHRRAASRLRLDAPSGLAALQQLILISFFEPSLRLDRASTEADRENARRAVPIEKERVLAGEKIIAAHEQVTPERVSRLQAYRSTVARQGVLEAGPARLGGVAGAFALNLLILSMLGLLLFFYRPAVYRSLRYVLLLAFLVLAVTAGAAAITRAGFPVALVPIAFPALVIAMLWDGRMAFSFALIMAILLSTQAPLASIDARLTMIIGGAAAALSAQVVQRRAQGLVLGSLIAGAYTVTWVALGLLLAWEPFLVFQHSVWGAANGVASALLALGFMPLFESYTRITTDQTLLELADLNRPLLKRLSLEASGTYAHSINVANLAEAAARAVGVNPLLVRVGAYYHDIGKMSTPQYFIENQAKGHNPHDALPPSTSAAIVRDHVINGLRLAEQAKLPESVRDFIPEHHGTQPVGFFYDRAREEVPESELDEKDFCYAGPRPCTKETAILMLADSVESATKALQEPTPERIRELVDRIVDDKITLGQLEDAPVTFRELTIIKGQFVAVLNGMYHHRIDYPSASRSPVTREETAGAGQAEAEFGRV